MSNRLTDAGFAKSAATQKGLAEFVAWLNQTEILDPALCAKWYEELFDVFQNN